MSMKKASLYLIFSAFCFAVMNYGVRMMGDIPTFQKALFRNLFPLIISSIVIIREKPELKFEKGAITFVLLRSILGTIGVIANFYSIDHLALADAAIFNKMSPFFIIILSAIFLKEKIKPYQAISLFIAFIGVYLVSGPNNLGFSTNHIIALFGGFCAGAAYTALRHVTKNLHVSNSIVIFSFSLISCLITIIPTIQNYAPMDNKTLFFGIVAGIGAALGQYGITNAYSLAASNRISIFDYTNILFNFIFGFVFFNEIIKLNALIGIVLIFGASLFMFIKNIKSVNQYEK